MGWIEFESFGFVCPYFADVFMGRQPQPGGKLPPRRELVRIGDRRRQGRRRDDPDPRNGLKPPRDREVSFSA